jgi:hypothetical protein
MAVARFKDEDGGGMLRGRGKWQLPLRKRTAVVRSKGCRVEVNGDGAIVSRA